MKTKRILLVDDTETVLMHNKMMLAGQGLTITTAKNGREALARIAEAPPDVVLLDIVMPELDGIQTCRRIKSDPKTRDIPVLMLTTKGQAEQVEQALLAGCNDFMTKPVRRLELLEKVRVFIDNIE